LGRFGRADKNVCPTGGGLEAIVEDCRREGQAEGDGLAGGDAEEERAGGVEVAGLDIRARGAGEEAHDDVDERVAPEHGPGRGAGGGG